MLDNHHALALSINWGGYMMQYRTTQVWIGNWKKHKDYSSVVNAAMALGKLSSIHRLMMDCPDVDKELLDAHQLEMQGIWNELQMTSFQLVAWPDPYPTFTAEQASQEVTVVFTKSQVQRFEEHYAKSTDLHALRWGQSFHQYFKLDRMNAGTKEWADKLYEANLTDAKKMVEARMDFTQ